MVQLERTGERPVSEDVPRGRRRLDPRAALLASGWVPAGLVTVFVMGLWVGSGVSVRDSVVFSLYLVLALVVPGTLIWRKVWGERPRPFALDLTAGLVIGYTVELPVYLLARALGVPALTPLWAVAVIGLAFLPSQRLLWRARGCVRMPVAWSWAMAGLVAFTVVWLAYVYMWQHPVGFADLAKSYSDEQVSLALVGELRHHLAEQIPWVASEPLRYHWYVYGHMAASSWVTGIEPAILLRRLSMTPLVIVPIIGAAVTASQLAKRVWVGPVCAALLVAVGPINSAWIMAALPYGQLFTDLGLALSPTATYGTAVFALVLMMSLRVLAPDEPPVSRWFWVTLCAVAGLQAGAKPTFLPMLLVGVATAIGVQLLTRRRASRACVGLLVMTFAWLLFARFVIFGGAGGGLGLRPLDAGDHAIRVLKPEGVEHPELVAAVIVGGVIVVLLAKVLAALALLPRRGWTDPRVGVLLGTSAAGWGAFVLLGHSGLSQAAFAKATAVPLCVAAAWGLARLVRAVQVPRLAMTVGCSALVIGAAVSAAMWAWIVTPYSEDLEGSWRVFVGPPVLVVVVVSTILLVISLLVPRVRRSPASMALAVCLGLIGSGALFALQALGAVAKPWDAPHNIRPALIGDGGLEAARWIRAHSSPDDVLATNEHQTLHTRSNRAFWLAANAERRVVVEGWGYTERTNSRYNATAIQNLRAPFWDPDKLRVNDAAFTRPTEKNVRRLADRYDARWLVLNSELPSRPRQLAKVADLRFSSGDYKVYEIPR